MKKFLKILTALGIIGGLVFLLMLTEASHSETKCSGLKVMVSYPGPDTLFTVEEIKQIVLALGDSLAVFAGAAGLWWPTFSAYAKKIAHFERKSRKKC